MGFPKKKADSEDSREDNAIYVVPPWAVPVKPRKRGVREAWERLQESRLWEMVKFEVKVILLFAVLIGMGFVGLKGMYRFKSKNGINTVPGVHGPNVVPFLK